LVLYVSVGEILINKKRAIEFFPYEDGKLQDIETWREFMKGWRIEE
jgi:hypothetical protein